VRRPLVLAALAVALLAVALVVAAALGAASHPVGALATRAPRETAMMRARVAEAASDGRRLSIDQRWVPYERISPLLRRAVLVAEDDAFFSHGGLDWAEIGAAARRNLEAGRIVRGGSTITQQLARNLFLGEQRTLSRKLEEAFIAVRLERALTKRRIFELYLNLIEWGDGIYGAEAASQRIFGMSAANLGPREAVLLAAVIINPRRVRVIAGRLKRRGDIDEQAYQLAINAPLPPAPIATTGALPGSAALPVEPGAESESVVTAPDSLP